MIIFILFLPSLLLALTAEDGCAVSGSTCCASYTTVCTTPPPPNTAAADQVLSLAIPVVQTQTSAMQLEVILIGEGVEGITLHPLTSANVSEAGVCSAMGPSTPAILCTPNGEECVSGFRCSAIDPTKTPPSHCLSHAQRIDYAGAGTTRYAYYAVKVKGGHSPLYTSNVVTTPANCQQLGLYTTIVGGDCAAEGPTLSSFSCATPPAFLAGAEVAPSSPPPPGGSGGSPPSPPTSCPQQCVAQCATVGGVESCDCASGVPVVTCHPAAADQVADDADDDGDDDDDGGLGGGAIFGIIVGVLIYCACYLVLMVLGWRSLPEVEQESSSHRRRSRRTSRRGSSVRLSRRSSKMMSFD